MNFNLKNSTKIMEFNPKKTVSSTILLVDDTPDNLLFLAKKLIEKGYHVKKAINGKSALLACQSNPPDLILLDIIMPEMDGYEVCKKLKANPKTREIPVIFISALEQVFDKVKAFELGGVDYINKPFEIEEVIARVKSQLTIQRQKKFLQEEIQKRKQKELELQQEIEKGKLAEEIIYQSRSLLVSLLNSSLDGISALEAIRDLKTGKILDFRCLLVNPVISQVFGKEADDLTGKVFVKKLLNKLDPQLFNKFVTVVETGKALEEDFCYNRGKIKRWYHFIAVKVGDGFSIIIRDITQRKNLEKDLENRSQLDGLTNIANRRFFDETFTQKWLHCAREKLPLSLILCDVDFFKLYNDNYGHQMGDNCLVKVAQAISTVVKRPGDLVARYGGEEFVVILPHTEPEGALQIAEFIRHHVQQLKIPHGASKVSNYVTLSLGVAGVVPTPKGISKALIAVADKALYEAKQQGRNRVILSTSPLLKLSKL